jgi:hypothetical protein
MPKNLLLGKSKGTFWKLSQEYLPSLGYVKRPCLKNQNTQKGRAGKRRAKEKIRSSMIEYFPSIHKVLGSVPNTEGKKKVS